MKQDLTDAELDELSDLLDATPAPHESLDMLMADGFLVGVLVQPRVVPLEEWLPCVFDADAQPIPSGFDPEWFARTQALLMRRHGALNAAISEDGWFDPVVGDIDRLPPASEYDVVKSPISRALLPWVAGFLFAQERFSTLSEQDDNSIFTALARIYRHLPPETDDERELIATLDKEHPLTDLDAAIEDLVNACVDLWDLTAPARFAVATVRRDAPKVGRNDACPCGSGKKFKACHGRA